jgi:hypothetical protein
MTPAETGGRSGIKSVSVWLCVLLGIGTATVWTRRQLSLPTIDSFPSAKQTRYFEFHSERNSSQTEGVERFVKTAPPAACGASQT